MNYISRDTTANSAIVKVGADGAIAVNTAGRTDVLVDVSGYWR